MTYFEQPYYPDVSSATPHVIAQLAKESLEPVKRFGFYGIIRKESKEAWAVFRTLITELAQTVPVRYDGDNYHHNSPLTKREKELFAENRTDGPTVILEAKDCWLHFHASVGQKAMTIWCTLLGTGVTFDALRAFLYLWFDTETVPSLPRKKETRTAFNMLVKTRNGIEARALMMRQKPFVMENYTKLIQDIFPTVAETLQADDPDGRLTILEGPPGTGKSHLIRALVTATKDKCTFFVINAPDIALVASPEYISALVDMCNENTPNVFILEDAEKALAPRQVVTRKKAGVDADYGAINALLNMTDGIYGEGLNLRVLATTNAQVDSFDPALLRNGRLAHHLRIPNLTAEEATARYTALTGDVKAFRTCPVGDVYHSARQFKDKDKTT